MKIDWQKFLDCIVKFGPIVISSLALFYARKKDKLLYTTNFFPEIRYAGLDKMDLSLKNLGPSIANEISASAFFIRFYDVKIPIFKSRRTLSKKVVYTLEYLPVGEKASFSIDASRFENRKFSTPFKWAIMLKWRGSDNERRSIIYIYDESKKRFAAASFLKRLHLIGQQYFHSNLKNY